MPLLRSLLLLIVFALALCEPACAQTLDVLMPASSATHTAVQSGRWDEPATWDNGVPTVAARVFIPPEKDVDRHVDAFPLWIRVEGTLRACEHCPTTLGVHTVLVRPGGVFELGTEAEPCTGQTVLEWVIGAPLPGDDLRLSGGLMVDGGTAVMHGKEKDAYGVLRKEIPVGATELTLRERPLGWEVGDELLIAGTDSKLVSTAPDLMYQSEYAQITEINFRTVKFDRPTKYRHFPWRPDLQVHVANLTRNVIVRTARDAAGNLPPIDRRGHIMVMMNGHSDFRAIEERDLGRTDKSREVTDPRRDAVSLMMVAGSQDNPRGRYADHVHKCGPLSSPHKRMWVVTRGSPGWGMVNHASHCQWDDCICIECFGSAFTTEEGQERGHMRRCLAAMNHGLGDHKDFTSTDSDHGRPLAADWGMDGSGFWLQGGLMEVSDCVSFDNSGRGFALFNRAMNGFPNYGSGNPIPEHLRFPILHDVSLLGPEYADITHQHSPHAVSSAVPQRVFARNTAYGNKIGAQAWSGPVFDGSGNRIFPLGVRSQIEDLTLWGRGGMLHLEYARQFDVDGLTIVGIGIPWDGLSRGTAVYMRSPEITVKDWSIEGWQGTWFAVVGAQDAGGIPAKNISIEGATVQPSGLVTINSTEE